MICCTHALEERARANRIDAERSAYLRRSIDAVVCLQSRIADLEAALRKTHAAVPGGQICTPQEVADAIRAIAASVGVKIED